MSMVTLFAGSVTLTDFPEAPLAAGHGWTLTFSAWPKSL